MADPSMWLMAGNVVSTGVSAWGAIQEGKQKQQADDYNANLVLQQGEFEAEKIAGEEELLTSTQRQMYAKSGVMLTGSPLEVMLNSATEFEMDKAIAKYNAESKANMLRYEGKQAAYAGEFKMGQTLLQGGTSLMGKIPTYSSVVNPKTGQITGGESPIG